MTIYETFFGGVRWSIFYLKYRLDSETTWWKNHFKFFKREKHNFYNSLYKL